MILNFCYNDDGAPTRVRQYDLLRATVGSAAEAEMEVVNILAKDPTCLRLRNLVLSPLLVPNVTEVQAMEPDLALAAANQVRSPLELLLLQNVLQLLSGGVAVIGDLVEFEVSHQRLSVWERSLPLYRVRGAALGLSLSTAPRLLDVIRKRRSNVIDPRVRAELEWHYFGPRLYELQVELLHLSRYPLGSRWTTSTAMLLTQLCEPRVCAYHNGARTRLTDSLTDDSVTVELDPITGALIITDCSELSDPLAEAVLEEARRRDTAVIYFSDWLALAVSPGLVRTDKVDVGEEALGEWPAFKRLGLASPVHYARLRAARAHPSQGTG